MLKNLDLIIENFKETLERLNSIKNQELLLNKATLQDLYEVNDKIEKLVDLTETLVNQISMPFKLAMKKKITSLRDVVDTTRGEAYIIRRLEIEGTISRISSRFVGISDINEGINKSLEDLGRTSGASRTYLYLFNEEKTHMTNTHEWCAKGIVPKIEKKQNIAYESLPWGFINLKRGDFLHVRDISSPPLEKNIDLSEFNSQNIKNLLVYPIYMKNDLLGFLGFDDLRKTRKWGPEDFALLRISSEILSNALEREISQKRLKESEEKYRKAYKQENFYKDLFAHDINNILNNILSSIQLHFLLKDIPDKKIEVDKLIETIKNQGLNGAKLISNVSKLSQFEENKNFIRKINLVEVIHDATKYIFKIYRDKKIHIEHIFPEEDLFVYANDLLLDVFENILINAIKYCERPSIEISIKIMPIYDNGHRYFKIEVIDNGRGIHPDIIQYIFKKGNYELKNSKGMGFGLSLVRKIIKSFDGKIWVENRVGDNYEKGSKFVFTLLKAPEVLEKELLSI